MTPPLDERRAILGGRNLFLRVPRRLHDIVSGAGMRAPRRRSQVGGRDPSATDHLPSRWKRSGVSDHLNDARAGATDNRIKKPGTWPSTSELSQTWPH